MTYEPSSLRDVIVLLIVAAAFFGFGWASKAWHARSKPVPPDARGDFRDSVETTAIECDWSRHYESKSVARKLDDGTWVGWTFWYGGGKHGEPEAIDWMDSAYELDVTEEQKLVTVRAFTKK